MLNSPTSAARVARYAVAVAVLAVVAAGGVFAWSFVGGDRPEEEVARTFLTALYGGDGDRAYGLTTTAYRALVLHEELSALSGELVAVAGDDVDLTILGSERTPGTQPLESLVGYTARTAVGPAEGVVTLFEVDGEWRVADVGYRFPEATADQVEGLRALTRRLNAQLEERARRLGGTPTPSGAN